MNKTPVTLTHDQELDIRAGLRRYAEFIRGLATTQSQLAASYTGETREQILRSVRKNREDADDLDRTNDLFRGATRIVIFYD